MEVNLGVRRIRAVNYTRTISLPKVWLANLGLAVGDQVELEMMEDGSLIIRPRWTEESQAEDGEEKA